MLFMLPDSMPVLVHSLVFDIQLLTSDTACEYNQQLGKQKAPQTNEEPLTFLINGLSGKLTGIAVAPT